jgi:hypothetical protein
MSDEVTSGEPFPTPEAFIRDRIATATHRGLTEAERARFEDWARANRARQRRRRETGELTIHQSWCD